MQGFLLKNILHNNFQFTRNQSDLNPNSSSSIHEAYQLPRRHKDAKVSRRKYAIHETNPTKKTCIFSCRFFKKLSKIKFYNFQKLKNQTKIILPSLTKSYVPFTLSYVSPMSYVICPTSYLAKLIALFSRITVTLICPGYCISSCIFCAILNDNSSA